MSTDIYFFILLAIFVFALLVTAIRILREYERGVVFTLGRFSRVAGPVKVNAVIYFRIVDPQRAIINVANYMAATSQLAQTTLRSVLGKHELDELLAERERLNNDIQAILDKHTDPWGIKVSNVEIKDVDLNESMVRAIARQAEAERLRRAKIINAEGEQQAAEKLVEAGRMLAPEPSAMQLRYFAALHDIAGERASTIVFPIPIDLFHMLKK